MIDSLCSFLRKYLDVWVTIVYLSVVPSQNDVPWKKQLFQLTTQTFTQALFLETTWHSWMYRSALCVLGTMALVCIIPSSSLIHYCFCKYQQCPNVLMPSLSMWWSAVCWKSYGSSPTRGRTVESLVLQGEDHSRISLRSEAGLQTWVSLPRIQAHKWQKAKPEAAGGMRIIPKTKTKQSTIDKSTQWREVWECQQEAEKDYHKVASSIARNVIFREFFQATKFISFFGLRSQSPLSTWFFLVGLKVRVPSASSG